MKANEKHFMVKAAAIWGVCALAVTVFYLGVVFPSQRSVEQVSSRLDGITRRYEQASESVRSRRLEEMRRQVILRQEELAKYMVAGDAARDNASRISQIAERAGIKGYSTRYRGSCLTTELGNCVHVGISRIDISWEGDFEQFARMVNELERHRPVIFVDGFVISRPDNPAEGCQIAVSLVIFVDIDGGMSAGAAERPAGV